MVKSDFIRHLNVLHKEDDLIKAVEFLENSTCLGRRVCKELVRHNWDVSKKGSFGTNVYHFLEVCVADEDIEYIPVIRKDAYFYVKYLDKYAAAFAILKIKNFKKSKHGR